MRFDLAFIGGSIATADGIHPGDVGIVDGKIAALGDLGREMAAETVDCVGLTLMPGVIDTQVHFREPGFTHKEDLESGTRSALMGGVTSVLEMPNTNPATTTAEALADKLRRAEGRAWCNYGFFIGASPSNVAELAGLEMLPGTPGIKIFMGSSTGSLLVEDDSVLERVLRNGRRPGPVHAEDEARNLARKSLISAHPSPTEHPFLRDAESARRATQRLIGLSRRTGRPVHILHISTADELPLISAAKREGLFVTAEATPQHLFFAAPECYERLGSRAQMNPPIRDAAHREALWQALGDGLFDVFGSDHAPHTLSEKELAYPASPSGMPGVQTMLPVLLNFVSEGRLPLETVVRMTSKAPARLYGMVGKGELAVGFDADLVAVDLAASRVFERSDVESKCGWSPYEGEALTGWPVHTVVAGALSVRDGVRQGPPAGLPITYDWKG